MQDIIEFLTTMRDNNGYCNASYLPSSWNETEQLGLRTVQCCYRDHPYNCCIVVQRACVVFKNKNPKEDKDRGIRGKAAKLLLTILERKYK
jgi:hypothetical protein